MKLFSLIKQGSIHLSRKKKIIPESEYSLLVEAQEIVEKAKQEAKELLAETKEECKALKKQAKEEGLQEGLSRFNQQILNLNEQINHIKLATQQQVLPIALKAAKKIVGEELQTNPAAIISIVQQALKPALHCQEIKIYVNKNDLESLQQEKENLKSKFERLHSLNIEERSDIDIGSCVIETEVGIINATLDNQWRALEAAFEKFAKQR